MKPLRACRSFVVICLALCAARCEPPEITATPRAEVTAATLTATPASVTAGGTVTVAVAGGPANTNDWVGLYRSTDADTSPISWQYLNGTKTPPATGTATASLSFTMPGTPGTYQLRFFQNETFTKIATSNDVTVTPAMSTAALRATPTSAQPGDALTVAVTGGPANPNDWVGFYLATATDDSPLDWKYLSGTRTPPATGVATATLTFTAPAATGTYQFRFFQNESFTKLATSNNVTVAPATTLTPSTTMATPGQMITVAVESGPGNPTDWLVLAKSGEDDRILLDWKYLNGTRTAPATGLTSATVSFTLPSTTGDYVFRLFASDGWAKRATSAIVQVR